MKIEIDGRLEEYVYRAESGDKVMWVAGSDVDSIVSLVSELVEPGEYPIGRFVHSSTVPEGVEIHDADQRSFALH